MPFDSSGGFNNRPLYVPRNRRKERQERRNAAMRFTSSVGEEDGWKPREDSKDMSQKVQDFMDERDHEEWGGPMALQESYQRLSEGTQREKHIAPDQTASGMSLDMLWKVRVPQNVGMQLLRHLGWREGSDAAMVTDESDIKLSKRRIRKIKLQSEKIVIPQPKLDTCGLGYERYHSAPEFQRYHQQRQERQRQQQMKRDVYRIDDVTNIGRPNPSHSSHPPDEHEHAGSYMAQGAIEELPTRSVGGFALDDDADDTYDKDQLGSTRVGKKNYDMVAYEESDDSDGDGEQAGAKVKGKQKSNTNLFSSWTSEAKHEDKARTWDGRQPLRGFVLGGSGESSSFQRFLGPDVPPGEIPRHVFGDDENPLVFQALSKAEQLQKSAIQREINARVSLNANAVVPTRSAAAAPPPDSQGTVFATNLAAAMKSRFAPAGSPSNEKATVSQISKGKVTSKRSLYTFTPARLLCKRFHVPAFATSTTESEPQKTTEQAYFEEEILKQVDREQATSAKVFKRKNTEKQNNQQSDKPPLKRPPMSLYKSIFNVTASDTEEEHDGNEPSPESGPLVVYNGPDNTDQPLTASKSGHVDVASSIPTNRNRRSSGQENSSMDKSRRHKSESSSRRDDDGRKKSKKKERKKSDHRLSRKHKKHKSKDKKREKT